MDIPIDVAEFAGRGLMVRTGGLFAGPRIHIDGQEAPRKRLLFTVTDNDGQAVELRLKPRFLDPIPRLVIHEQAVDLARPLQWYEYAWMGLPLLMIFIGGCLGAVLGIGAAYANSYIFRSELSGPARYGLTGLISFGIFFTFLFIALIVGVATGDVPTE